MEEYKVQRYPFPIPMAIIFTLLGLGIIALANHLEQTNQIIIIYNTLQIPNILTGLCGGVLIFVGFFFFLITLVKLNNLGH